jgi:hypothetical protein
MVKEAGGTRMVPDPDRIGTASEKAIINDPRFTVMSGGSVGLGISQAAFNEAREAAKMSGSALVDAKLRITDLEAALTDRDAEIERLKALVGEESPDTAEGSDNATKPAKPAKAAKAARGSENKAAKATEQK